MVLVLCSAFLCITLSSKAQVLEPGQVYTTGNVVQNTPYGGPTPWVGGVYQDSLTCWAWGDPGYCGPNAIVRPGNNINFSYGSTYLYQQQHITSLLPSGTGLQVNGFNFGFTAKNGNGWDNGATDSLTALVRFWDNTGGKGANNLLYGTSYNLNYKFNWTTFNYSETFTTPLPVASIGQVQYGFIGRDNNGWAGPYGPEINNVNFSLKYSVDPCATNVLSSPSCPGYLDALAKLTPQTSTTTSAITETTTTGTITVVDSVIISPTGTYGTSPAPGSSPPPDSSQPLSPAPAGGNILLSGGSIPIQQASITAPSTTQAKVGEVSDSAGSSKTTVSLSSVLSMISSNQEKTSALEKSVTQAADAQAFSAGETAKQQAEKIAGEAQAQSIAISNSQTTNVVQSNAQQFNSPIQSSAVSLQGNLQSNTVMNISRAEQSVTASNNQSLTSINASTQQSNQNTGKQDTFGPMQIGLIAPKYEPPKVDMSNAQSFTQGQYQPTNVRQEVVVASVSPTVSYSLIPTIKMPTQIQIETPTTEGIKFGHKGVLENAMEEKPFVSQTNQEQKQNDGIKKNVQNNELAGGVSIESIARQPTNYAQYFTMIPDAAFYVPKEIYKNQKTVDNVKALRSLSSDRLHQQMIDSQYKLGE